jgi:hypothetical protein
MTLLPRIVFVVLLAGCASGTPGLSSLGREAHVTPLREQDVTRVRLDDGECERWTRATKGKNEPLPSADLRYAACAVARGYQVTMGYATISSQTARMLDTVLTEWRECRADKVEMSAESYLVPLQGLCGRVQARPSPGVPDHPRLHRRGHPASGGSARSDAANAMIESRSQDVDKWRCEGLKDGDTARTEKPTATK